MPERGRDGQPAEAATVDTSVPTAGLGYGTFLAVIAHRNP